ncbi:hypothetical protein Tco_0947785 [Tanacetum coccineum]
MYYPRFTKVIIHYFLIQEKSLSWRNRIGMHTSKDDYLINTLRFVSRREASQKYGAVLPKCLTSPEMKESKAYKTYISYATGVVPPKVARKFKKASPSKKDSVPVKADEEPIQKSKRVKRASKKSLTTPAAALTEEAQIKEVKKKSLRDFHKTHPSGSGTVAEKPPSVEKITPTSWGNDEDDSNNEQESSDESSKQENESEEQELDSKQDEESDDDDQEQEDSTQEQVVKDAHVTIFTVPKKTKVPVTSSSRSSDLASKFLIFLDIPQTDAEIVSPLDVHATPTPPPIIETTNPLSNLPDFASVFRFKDRITTLEKEVANLKKDPLHTQVTSLVDSHLDIRLEETREEFMNFLSESLTARIKEQVKDQLPQILPQEVSIFTSPVIEKLIKESRDEVTLAKASYQPQSTYEAASTLTEFELKKILLDKIETSESYLTAPEHRDCYDGLKKSYVLDKYFFYSYDVYSLKHGRNDKDKDEDPSDGSDRGSKKRKTSKNDEPTTGSKKKDSTSGSSKGTKSQPKSTGKSVQPEEPVFEVADSYMPQDQVGNMGDNKDEPRDETASRHDWFKKPTPPPLTLTGILERLLRKD